LEKRDVVSSVNSLLCGATENSVIFIGLGNCDRSDDGIGLYMAERLKRTGQLRVYTETERSVESLVWDAVHDDCIATVIFFDAVSAGAAPGDIVIVSRENADLAAQPISTHKVPVLFIMQWLIQAGKTPYIIGIQPKSLAFMGDMSPECKETAQCVVLEIRRIMNCSE